MHFNLRIGCLLSILVLSSGIYYEANAKGVVTLGVGLEGSTSMFSLEDDDEDTGVGLVPMIRYDRGRLGIGLDGLSYQVLQSERTELSVALGFDGESLFVGSEAEWRFEPWYVRAGARKTISGDASGEELEAAFGRRWRFKAHRELDLALGARYQSDQLFRRGLFGLDLNDRDEQVTDSTVNSSFVSASYTHPVTTTQGILINAEFEYFGDSLDALKSVNRNKAFRVGAAYFWLFY